MRRLLALLALFVAVVAGCAGGQPASHADVQVVPLPAPDAEPGASLPVPDEASVPDVDIARDVGPPDAGALARAGAEALAVTSFEMVAEARVAGQGEAFSMSAAFAKDGTTGMLRLDILGEPVEVRFVDDTVYMTSNFMAWLVPADTPWIGIADTEQSAEAGFEMDEFSADELVSLLETMDSDAEIVGTEELDGVRTTRVRAEISVDDLVAAGIDSMIEEFDMTGGAAVNVDSLTLDVWVGDDGILRRMVLGAGDGFELRMDIRSVGEPVEVSAPPAHEITWVDDLLADLGLPAN